MRSVAKQMRPVTERSRLFANQMRSITLHEVDRASYLRSIRQLGVSTRQDWACRTMPLVLFSTQQSALWQQILTHHEVDSLNYRMH